MWANFLQKKTYNDVKFKSVKIKLECSLHTCIGNSKKTGKHDNFVRQKCDWLGTIFKKKFIFEIMNDRAVKLIKDF